MRNIIILTSLLFSFNVLAQTATVNQGAPGKQGAWSVKPVLPDSADPTVIAVSTTSACIGPSCATVVDYTGKCVEVNCNVDANYSTNISTVTATTNHKDIYARTPKRFCFVGANNAIGFITASGSGTCKVSVISTASVQ